jgi:hypothetical protein
MRALVARRTARRLAGGLAVALIACSAASASSAASAASAARATSPRAGGSSPVTQDGLQAVACPVATFCTAVGARASGTSTAALAEVRKSSSWAVTATPLPSGASSSALLGVSCASSSSCLAVGYYLEKSGLSFPLAELWNGTGWTGEAPPFPSGSPQNELSAISCSSAKSCVAVGTWQSARYVPYSLAESWNGSTWSVKATPQPLETAESFLTGVSCATATTCEAVGRYIDHQDVQKVLVERWSAGKWSALTAPEPAGTSSAGLDAVSCASASTCVGVGGYLPSAKGSTERPLAETWNGTRWSVSPVTGPAGTTGAYLLGVACASAKACTATGGATGAGRKPVTVGEAWNGSRWSAEATTEPTGSAAATLSGVSCAAVNACVAGGFYAKTAGAKTQPFAEGWNGSRWALETIPS